MMNMNNLAQTHEILTPQLATKVGLTKYEFYKKVKANTVDWMEGGITCLLTRTGSTALG